MVVDKEELGTILVCYLRGNREASLAFYRKCHLL